MDSIIIACPNTHTHTHACMHTQTNTHLRSFWSMLGYLANTLIFILVGVVIMQRAFSNVQDVDWMYMAALYIGITVIRSAIVRANA